jgi:hypothetical protein
VKRSPLPNLVLDPARESLISSSGALLLKETVRVIDVARGLSQALSPWRAVRTVHDPGKVLLDVAMAVALGGDCLADVAAVRAQPAVFGAVAESYRLRDHHARADTLRQAATGTRRPLQ